MELNLVDYVLSQEYNLKERRIENKSSMIF